MEPTPQSPVTLLLRRHRIVWQPGLALLFAVSTFLIPINADPDLDEPAQTALFRWLPATYVLVLYAALSCQAARPLHPDHALDKRIGLVFAILAAAPFAGLALSLALLATPSPDSGDASGVSADLDTSLRALRYLVFLPMLMYVVAAARVVQRRHGTLLDRNMWWASALLTSFLGLASLSWSSTTASIDALLVLAAAPNVAVLYRGVARNHRKQDYLLAMPPPMPRI